MPGGWRKEDLLLQKLIISREYRCFACGARTSGGLLLPSKFNFGYARYTSDSFLKHILKLTNLIEYVHVTNFWWGPFRALIVIDPLQWKSLVNWFWWDEPFSLLFFFFKSHNKCL